MEFTGIIIKTLSYASTLVAVAIIGIGLFIVVNYIIVEYLLRPLLVGLKVWKVFYQFIWHRREFLRWLKNREEE